jgi:hypothetical protein
MQHNVTFDIERDNPANHIRGRLLCRVSFRRMTAKASFHHSRRSTRVPLRVTIVVHGGASNLTCEGETVIVNLHGALISTMVRLIVGMRILIHVYMTDKRAAARIVYVDLENPLHSGIELEQPRNIWGVSLPPEDWQESEVSR